jgi:hypothetical protein
LDRVMKVLTKLQIAYDGSLSSFHSKFKAIPRTKHNYYLLVMFLQVENEQIILGVLIIIVKMECLREFEGI